MEAEVLGSAGRIRVYRVKCKCGEEAYLICGRWQSIDFIEIKDVVDTLMEMASKEREYAYRPFIRRTTRKIHLEMAEELEELAKKVRSTATQISK